MIWLLWAPCRDCSQTKQKQQAAYCDSQLCFYCWVTSWGRSTYDGSKDKTAGWLDVQTKHWTLKQETADCLNNMF